MLQVPGRGPGEQGSHCASTRSKQSAPETFSRRPHTSLAELAYEALAEAILDHKFAAAARVTIEGLASQLEMSITPVREALARAAANGLVTLDSNRGYRVSPMLSRRDFHAIFVARQMLELQALEGGLINDQAISRLLQIVAVMPDLEHGPVYRNFREFTREDHRFHRTLVGISDNRFLVQAWDGLNFHLQISRLYAGEGVIDFADALHEHTTIAEALADHDKKRAVEAVQTHISRAEARLTVLLPEEDHLPTESTVPSPRTNTRIVVE